MDFNLAVFQKKELKHDCMRFYMPLQSLPGDKLLVGVTRKAGLGGVRTSNSYFYVPLLKSLQDWLHNLRGPVQSEMQAPCSKLLRLSRLWQQSIKPSEGLCDSAACWSRGGAWAFIIVISLLFTVQYKKLSSLYKVVWGLTIKCANLLQWCR